MLFSTKIIFILRGCFIISKEFYEDEFDLDEIKLKKPDTENGKITKKILIVLYFILVIVLIILLFLNYKIVFLKVEETNNKNTTINTKNIINEYEYFINNIS